jgi:2-polyprenyl-3-methyl-5-hydroxy-6-metoxy-1,4-benzoquinol methylase
MFELFSTPDQRARRAEWLDDPLVPPGALHTTLRAVGRINRVTSGLQTSLAGVRRLLTNADDAVGTRQTPLRIMDVGTGDGAFLDAVDRWSRRTDTCVELLGVELRDPVVSRLRRKFGNHPHICVERVNVFDLDASREFHILHASLVLHHFAPEDVARALTRMAQLSRLGVVVNDLQRHWAAYLGSHLLTRALTRDTMARRDGPLSVLRGFTRDELLDVSRRSPLDNIELTWRWPFRWLLTGEPSELN